jgi:hypothetical protein
MGSIIWSKPSQSLYKSADLYQLFTCSSAWLQGGTATELAEFSLHSFAVPNRSVAGQHSQHFEFVSLDYQNPMPIYRAMQVCDSYLVNVQKCPLFLPCSWHSHLKYDNLMWQ